MEKIPSGKVTFLFTDIEGSTRLAQEFPDTLSASLERHNSILRETVESNKGFVFDFVGDAFCCAFENASDAVRAAHDIQVKLRSEKWENAVIKIRVGIHTGEAVWDGNDYSGYITLARTARIMSVAYGEQIIVSEATFNSIKDDLPVNISFRDMGERRLKDLKHPVCLYQVLSEKLPDDFPPLKTLDARPNNLPVQLTSFIGRQGDLQKIKELLRKTSLLTVIGPGGAGKTRLALQAGAELIDDFKNGVWFADISPVTDGSLIIRTISKIFGITEEPKKPLEDTFLEYLKDKELILILDNCEQIIDACSGLAEKILSRCRDVKILASSRESLRNHGEQLYYLSSLEYPENKKNVMAEEIIKYESVKLFIERAKAVRSDFEITNENAATLGEICKQLDGIPLAIELAASRVKVLSLESIKERLNDRFKFLTGGLRTALPRQQTLRALIDWSYDLLSVKEKLLLNRLSVFSDGWTLEAAENVCSDDILKKYEVMDILSQLIDKSLIINCSDEGRYRILETIRQYGEELLAESGEIHIIIIKHLDYYVKFAEAARLEIEGPDQREWMDKLELENFNFRTAITTSIVRDQREKGLHLAITLSRFWETRGYISEAMKFLEELISIYDDISTDLKGKAFQWLGTFNWITGDYERSLYYYEECHKIQIELNDKRGLGVSHTNLGIIKFARGDYEKSKYHCEESYRIFQELGDEHLAADCLLNLGAPLVNLGELDYAGKVFEKSLKIYRELGDGRGEAMALNNLGKLSEYKDDYDSARVYLEESLVILRKLKERRGIIEILNNLSVCYSYLGFNSKAREYLEESLEINSAMGYKKVLADSKNLLGFIEYDEGNWIIAFNLHFESLKIRKELNNRTGICTSLIGLSRVYSKKDPFKSAEILIAVKETLKSFEFEPLKQIEDELNKAMNYLKENLSEKDFSGVMESGKKLTLDDAAEMALNFSME